MNKRGRGLLIYIDDENEEGLIFDGRCPQCGRYVKNDDTIMVNGFGQPSLLEPNATCKIHGRVTMLFLGYQ